MTELAICVDNLGQQYRIGGVRERYGRFTETLIESLTAPVRRVITTAESGGKYESGIHRDTR